ncbi:pesticidal protein Cry28Aa [Robiginitalea sp. SC105]|nr:pesticidal protein Cry28Aa [Robiginitalea sp. SC105]
METLGNTRQRAGLSISDWAPVLLWTAFSAIAAYGLWSFGELPDWKWEGILRINGFTILLWGTVTLFSAIVASYSRKYLTGFRHRSRFMALTLCFTLTVMTLLISEHLLLLLLSWLGMGMVMSGLIGIRTEWREARAAARYSRRYFLAGSAFLGIGMFLPAFWTGNFTLSGLLGAIPALPAILISVTAACLILAAIIQSAMYPFHRWLLSSMTAPTPASALMHAGFVNGAGILLALFSPFLFASDTLTLLFIIGGLTAILAQFAKLLQVNVKQRLACSTIAQMGFMIMQCGLGFFSAAVAHLILHGFYKAYLFLSAGEGIAQSEPQAPPRIRIKPLQAVAVLIHGFLGALLFMQLTGKGGGLGSGSFLTLIVAITVGQATYNIVKHEGFTAVQRLLVPPLLYVAGIGLYALVFNGVAAFMSDMPLVTESMPLTATEIGFGLVFLAGFFVMKLGLYLKHPWFYVKLMNLTQPIKQTV